MPLPSALSNLRLPLIAAPMFLVSGLELVIASCRAGIVGAFPALNARTSEEFESWLQQLKDKLAPIENAAPFAVNLIVHKTNARAAEDAQLCIKHKIPIIITSLGLDADIIKDVHAYGGIVLHDVISERHADKAIAAGVDGLILVCAGAGGHTGTLNPFAFVATIRKKFAGPLVVSGGISDGRAIAAIQALGANLAYMGTRFIATAESNADAAYKQMLLDVTMADIVGTANVSGVFGNFMRPSLEAAGVDLTAAPATDLGLNKRHSAWKSIWSAGQGVGAINDIPTVATLVERLEQEYQDAVRSMMPGIF